MRRPIKPFFEPQTKEETHNTMMMIGLGLAILGAGLGFGLIGYGAMTGMSRQPEALGRLQTAMLIAFAFVELTFLLTLFLAPANFSKL